MWTIVPWRGNRVEWDESKTRAHREIIKNSTHLRTTEQRAKTNAPRKWTIFKWWHNYSGSKWSAHNKYLKLCQRAKTQIANFSWNLSIAMKAFCRLRVALWSEKSAANLICIIIKQVEWRSHLAQKAESISVYKTLEHLKITPGRTRFDTFSRLCSCRNFVRHQRNYLKAAAAA